MKNRQIADRFKIRCSAIGKIKTNGKGKSYAEQFDDLDKKVFEQKERLNATKNKETKTAIKLAESINSNESEMFRLKKLPNFDAPVLGDTCKSYCLDWIKQQPESYTGRKEFSNKYTEKGLIVEDHSIDFVAEQLGHGMLIKNESSFSNDFMTGTPDVILPESIIDVKNSFDPFTFPLFDTELPSKDYWWQGQGYLNLVGRKKYQVIYTLMNTPINIIEREARSYCYKNGFDPDDVDILEAHVQKMTYDDVSDKNRIKTFEFDFDQGAIDQIESRVKECREFIFSVLEKC